MDIFNSVPGLVAVYDIEGGLPGAISIHDLLLEAAIIQNVQVDHKTAQQISPTLAAAVYMYVFGDEPGELTIEGLAFAGMCGGEVSGLESLLDAYEELKVSSTSVPVAVTIGSRTMSGYVIGFHAQVYDVERHVDSFQLRMFSMPKEFLGPTSSLSAEQIAARRAAVEVD